MKSEWLYRFLILFGDKKTFVEFNVLLDLNCVDEGCLTYYAEPSSVEYLKANVLKYFISDKELEDTVILKCEKIEGVFIDLIQLQKDSKTEQLQNYSIVVPKVGDKVKLKDKFGDLSDVVWSVLNVDKSMVRLAALSGSYSLGDIKFVFLNDFNKDFEIIRKV